MLKLLDSFVEWFNGLFGLEYAGYDWITALAFIFLAAVAFYFLLKAAIRPLIPLFNADHTKINANLPDIEKGVRESHRRGTAPAPAYSAEKSTPTANLAAEPVARPRPLIHILPMEDLNHASEEASRLAGLLADGIADTLSNIQEVETYRARVDDDTSALNQIQANRYCVNGTVIPEEEQMSVTLTVRDAASGQGILKHSETCTYDQMPKLERTLAAEVASAVVMQDRQRQQNTGALINSAQQAGPSGSTYPSDRRPSLALPRKTGRPIA